MVAGYNQVLTNMQKRLSRLLVLISAAVLWYGCSTETIEPSGASVGTNYFPLEVGLFIEYDVLEVNINLSGGDTSRYQLQETLVDSYINEANREVFLLQRATRPNANQDWIIEALWTVTNVENGILVTENNIGLLKMVFPLRNNIEWDGNTYNSRFPSTFSALIQEADTTINGLPLTDLARVALANIPENLTGIDQKFEFYAPDIGLVAKDYITLEYCTRDCTGERQIEGGRILRQSIINYGKN